MTHVHSQADFDAFQFDFGFNSTPTEEPNWSNNAAVPSYLENEMWPPSGLSDFCVSPAPSNTSSLNLGSNLGAHSRGISMTSQPAFGLSEPPAYHDQPLFDQHDAKCHHESNTLEPQLGLMPPFSAGPDVTTPVQTASIAIPPRYEPSWLYTEPCLGGQSPASLESGYRDVPSPLQLRPQTPASSLPNGLFGAGKPNLMPETPTPPSSSPQTFLNSDLMGLPRYYPKIRKIPSFIAQPSGQSPSPVQAFTIPKSRLRKSPSSAFLSGKPSLSPTRHDTPPPIPMNPSTPHPPGRNISMPRNIADAPFLATSSSQHNIRGSSTLPRSMGKSKSMSNVRGGTRSISRGSRHASRNQLRALPSRPSLGVSFVNFTPDDSHKLLSGVAPSGSSKTKARREQEAREKKRRLEEAALLAIQRAGGDPDDFSSVIH